MQYILILLIGCAAGIVTGLIGASGVMVVVPALGLLGFSASESIGASLFIDTVASLVVSWTYYQNKNLNLRQGIWIAIGAVIGAQVGSLLSQFVPDIGLSRAFSIFLLICAVIFGLRGRGTLKADAIVSNGDRSSTQPNTILKTLRSHITVSGLLLGFLVGIVSGLLGAGGGVMILLILVFIMQYSMHEGIGTSTFIMAITAASGAIGHALTSSLPIKAAVIGAIGTLIGGRLAARFANKVNDQVLSRVVGGIFAVLGIMMLITSK